MAADCCNMQVRIVLLVFFCYVGTILSHQKLDCVVGAILNCQCQQSVLEAVINCVEDFYVLILDEETNQIGVVFNNCVVYWQEAL